MRRQSEIIPVHCKTQCPNVGGRLPYVRALRPSLPRNCLRQFLAPIHFFEGEVSPSLQTQGFPLPPQRDGSVFFPPPSLHSAGARFPCPQRPIYGVFVFFRKAENVSLREQTKTRRASAACDMPAMPIKEQAAACDMVHGNVI